MEEKWVMVRETENSYYEVSDRGRVRRGTYLGSHKRNGYVTSTLGNRRDLKKKYLI